MDMLLEELASKVKKVTLEYEPNSKCTWDQYLMIPKYSAYGHFYDPDGYVAGQDMNSRFSGAALIRIKFDGVEYLGEACRWRGRRKDDERKTVHSCWMLAPTLKEAVILATRCFNDLAGKVYDSPAESWVVPEYEQE